MKRQVFYKNTEHKLKIIIDDISNLSGYTAKLTSKDLKTNTELTTATGSISGNQIIFTLIYTSIVKRGSFEMRLWNDTQNPVTDSPFFRFQNKFIVKSINV